MKFKLPAILMISLVFTSGCQNAPNSNGLATGTVITGTTDPAIPALEASNSIIDCSGWDEGALTYIRQQGHLMIGDTYYGVATFACGVPDSEFGAEFIESFIWSDGIWAANGLVAGPSTQFVTTSACVSTQIISCPVVEVTTDMEELDPGTVVIYEKDGGLAWRFEKS